MFLNHEPLELPLTKKNFVFKTHVVVQIMELWHNHLSVLSLKTGRALRNPINWPVIGACNKTRHSVHQFKGCNKRVQNLL